MSSSVSFSVLRPPKRRLRIFLSASHKDCHAEREVIFNTILPRLRREHRKDGIEISISDMSWGVRDERSDSHHSWDDCAKEIKCCFDECQGGTFFISLQGEKFGYTVLPRKIEKDAFEKCMEDNMMIYEDKNVPITKKDENGAVTQSNLTEVLNKMQNESASRSLPSIADMWYDMDENTVPPSYLLRNINESNCESWVMDKVYLLKLFENLPCYRELLVKDDHDPLLINRSASEFEIRYACSLASGSSIAPPPLWVHRKFLRSGNLYSYDKSTTLKLKNLQAWMTGELSCGAQIRDLSVDFEQYIRGEGSSFENYISSFTIFMYEKLSQSVQHVLSACKRWWQENTFKLKLSEEDLLEICHHYHYSHAQCQLYCGRNGLLTQAISCIDKWVLQSDNVPHKPLSGICLSIVGAAGVGKSSFAAALSHRLREAEKSAGMSARPVICRFCDVTMESTNCMQLVRSICLEIHRCFNIFDDSPISRNYADLRDYFHLLLHRFGVILIIDGLDSIGDDFEGGRHMLSFLRNVRPGQNTRIVVSTRSDERIKKTSEWRHCYGCDTSLQQSNVECIKVSFFKDKSSEYNADLQGDVLPIMEKFIKLFGEEKVRITRKQLEKSIKILATERPPSALAAQLAAMLLLELPSFAEVNLEKAEKSLIAQVIKMLEKNYGKRLVTLSFSFITFSKCGVNSVEMEDLLSLDSELVADFQDYQSSSVKRIASFAWQRLKSASAFLLRDNKHGRMQWAHSGVKSFALRKYSEDSFTKTYVHQLMGQYFADIVEARIQVQRGITRQPMTFTEVPVWFKNTCINRRRFEEGFHHLVEAGMLHQACEEACHLDSVCAFFRCGLADNMLASLTALHRAVIRTGEAKRTVFSFSESFFNRVDHYMRWLRQTNRDIKSQGDPTCAIFTTFSFTQPVYSCVWADGATLFPTGSDIEKLQMFKNWPSVRIKPVLIGGDAWKRGICLGERIQFQSQFCVLRHSRPVTHVLWNQSDARMLISVAEKTMQVWNSTNAQILETHLLPSEVHSVAISEDASKIACGSKDKTIRVFDAATSCVNLTLHGHVGFVSALHFSPCHSKLCSGSTDCSVKMWSLAGGSIIQSFEGHSFEVTQVMFSPENKRVVSCSLDKTVKMWELATGELQFSLDGVFSHVNSVCFDPSGRMIAVGSDYCDVYLLDSISGDNIFTLNGHLGPVRSVSFNCDGSLLASGSSDKTMKVWHVATGTLLGSVSDHKDCVNFVRFSPHDNVVASASNDMTVRLFDASFELLTPLQKSFDSSYEDGRSSVNSICFSPDGTKLVSTSGSQVLVWAAASRIILATLSLTSGIAISASFNANESLICSCASDGIVTVWDASSYQSRHSVISRGVTSVSFTLDGLKVVMRHSNSTVKFWNFSEDTIVHESKRFGDESQVDEPFQVNLVTFCPEGLLRTAFLKNSNICLYDVVTSEHISSLQHAEEASPRSISYSPDGLTVAVGRRDGTIGLFAVLSGACCTTLSGHSAAVTSLCFNHESSLLVSGSEDWCIKLWDVHGGVLLATLRGHSDTVSFVTFSPCGQRVATASRDSSAMLWDALEMRDSSEPPTPSLCSKLSAETTQWKDSTNDAPDSDDEFLTENERRIKYYRFQHIDGW